MDILPAIPGRTVDTAPYVAPICAPSNGKGWSTGGEGRINFQAAAWPWKVLGQVLTSLLHPSSGPPTLAPPSSASLRLMSILSAHLGNQRYCSLMTLIDPPLQSRLNGNKIGIPLARKKGERLFIKHIGSYVCHGTVLSCISLLVQTGSSLKEQRLCLFHLGTIHVSHDKGV